MVTTDPSQPPEVADVFDTYPPPIRSKLLAIRHLIFKSAAATKGVGPISETLKWGEPAYLTQETKAGSTIRLGWKPSMADSFAIYFNCQTSLIETFRRLFSDRLSFEGNRAIIIKASDDLDEMPLGPCIEMALSYHRTKRKRA
ncbi:MAG: DUF1801 domain-containing protein [Rhodospirillales bacterium]|nr:DUF1801 domain-containing protein [Rhodospirillales bacterium]